MEHSPWGSPTDSAKDDQTTKASMIGDHSIEIHHSSDGETNWTGNRGLQITSFGMSNIKFRLPKFLLLQNIFGLGIFSLVFLFSLNFCCS